MLSYDYSFCHRAAVTILHQMQDRGFDVPQLPQPRATIRHSPRQEDQTHTTVVVRITSEREANRIEITIQFRYRRTVEGGIEADFIASVHNPGVAPVDSHGNAEDDGLGHITLNLFQGLKNEPALP